MAKRKRLTPAILGTAPVQSDDSDPHTSRPPIARVAGDVASEAAFAEVAGALTAAREEGRLIVRLPLAAIEVDHLARDRIAFDDGDMAALQASLEARGQQVPIEVVAIEGSDGRYGLISGLRRVLALRGIGAEDVLALVRQPDSSAEAYLAMVEENEIRAGISFYERARVAVEAARLGVYDSPHAAIAALFGQASPAKRSKIGSFVAVHNALKDVLRFPATIPERVGLALSKAVSNDAGFAQRLGDALRDAGPETPDAERAVIEKALKTRRQPGRPKPSSSPRQIAPGIFVERAKGRMTLTGEGVTDALEQSLIAWLEAKS